MSPPVTRKQGSSARRGLDAVGLRRICDGTFSPWSAVGDGALIALIMSDARTMLDGVDWEREVFSTH